MQILYKVPAAPAFSSGGAVHEVRDARLHDRPGAHRAGLEGHVDDGVEQPPAPHARRGLLDGEQLGVSERALAHLTLVAGCADDLAVEHDHASDGHVAVVRGALGLTQRQAHEVLVAGKVGAGHGCIMPECGLKRNTGHIPDAVYCRHVTADSIRNHLGEQR